MKRVAVVGAGGIGGILAAAAHEAGNDVTVCVRTPIDRLVIEREGCPLEHEELTGAVVRRADAAGVAVPLSRAVLTLLRLLDRSLQRETKLVAS